MTCFTAASMFRIMEFLCVSSLEFSESEVLKYMLKYLSFFFAAPVALSLNEKPDFQSCLSSRVDLFSYLHFLLHTTLTFCWSFSAFKSIEIA